METLKDINSLWNVGGVLTHARSVQHQGGTLKEYDSSAVGGPPSFDFDKDVREPHSYSVTTLVVGATDAARKAFIDKFEEGTIFSGKTVPSGPNQFNITGKDVDGFDYVVTESHVSGSYQENSELQFTIKEKGPTPV